MLNLRKPTIVGRPMVRVEGQLKTTGQARYLDDLTFEVQPLSARLVLSRRPHADITIDTTAAEAVPGVLKVLTGRDLPGMLGRRLGDRPLLAHDRVLYTGQPLAIVAASTPEAAESAAEAVRVSYIDRPAVLEIEQAIAFEAPLLHPNLGQYKRHSMALPQPGSNIAHESRARRGDLQQGWRDAAVVIEGIYNAAPTHHMAMEPHGAVAVMDAEGVVTLWASTQNPTLQQQMTCQALGLAPERLRVLTAYVGGSFGGKSFVSIEALAVALALTLPGQPIKLVLPRSQDLSSTFTRPGLTAYLKMGAASDGSLTAFEASYDWDAGASADALIEMVANIVHTGAGPYRIPHVAITSRAIYTNRTPAAPMRGNGMAEVQWAVEQHIDQIALALNTDAVAFRLRHCLKGGDPLFDQNRMHATGLDACLRRVAKSIHWPSGPARPGAGHKARGVGVALGWNPVFAAVGEAQPPAHASIHLGAPQGPILLDLSGVDIGQGLHTVAVQLAASTLGVPLDWLQVRPSAESIHAGDEETPRNQLTWSTGNAIVNAASALRSAILRWAASEWREAPGALDIVEGLIISHSTARKLSLLDYANDAANEGDNDLNQRVLSAEGRFQPQWPAAEGAAAPILQIGAGAQAAEVEVDLETGEVHILKLVAAFDAGHAINPDIVEAQIRGGAIQGLGAALFEKIAPVAGDPRLPNLTEYRIATIRDIPASVEAITVEVPQDTGPFGARGVGEHTAIAAAPALANAIQRATGARLYRLPISSESIWLALHSGANAPETPDPGGFGNL